VPSGPGRYFYGVAAARPRMIRAVPVPA
jgi:hypothetical protein